MYIQYVRRVLFNDGEVYPEWNKHLNEGEKPDQYTFRLDLNDQFVTVVKNGKDFVSRPLTAIAEIYHGENPTQK